MPLIVCEPKILTNSTGACNDLGGWYKGFYTKVSNINWDAILADVDAMDQVNRVVHTLTENPGTTWAPIEPRGEGTNYAFNFARQTRYDCTVNFVFDGKDEVRTANLQSAIACCDILLVLFCNNGKHRIVGKDFNGAAFANPYRNFNISTHNDNSGTIGTDNANDVVAMNGVQVWAPLYFDGTEADFL